MHVPGTQTFYAHFQFSPTSENLLLAYGRRHSSLLKSVLIDGEITVPTYTILEVLLMYLTPPPPTFSFHFPLPIPLSSFYDHVLNQLIEIKPFRPQHLELIE